MRQQRLHPKRNPSWRKGATTPQDLPKHFGKKKWATNVFAAVQILSDAFQPDYVVIGGGNVTELNELPDNIMQGSNKLAILGGFSLWRKKWIYP